MPNRDYQFLEPCTLRECVTQRRTLESKLAGKWYAQHSVALHSNPSIQAYTHMQSTASSRHVSAHCVRESPSISLRVLILLLRALLRISRIIVRLLLLLGLLLLRLRPRGRRWRRRLSVLL